MHIEIVSLALALPHIKQGTIKLLTVFTEKRIATLPDVPTIAEAGYPERPTFPGTTLHDGRGVDFARQYLWVRRHLKW